MNMPMDLIQHRSRQCLTILMALFLVGFLSGTVHALGTLTVQDANGTPVSNFRWLLEEDVNYHPDPNANPQPADPDPDALAANFHKSYLPAVAGGDSGDLAALSAAVDPTKYYFLSVLPSDATGNIAYTLGGGAIVPGQADLTVTVNQLPLKTAQISIFVYHDNAPINNQADLPAESGLEGFQIILEEPAGRYGAAGGQVLYDAYGNFIGTTYQTDGNGDYILDGEGLPIVETLGSGALTTNANGVVVIKNLPPGKFGVLIDPPEGEGWIQTATIEGTPVIDAWVKSNEPSYFTEFGPAGHHVEFGFIQEFNNIANLPGDGVATLSGTIKRNHMSRPPDYSFHFGSVFPETYVGLNEMANGVGTGVYAGACDPTTGAFSISGIPAGTYQLVIWDLPLDIVFASVGVTINDAGQCLQKDGTYGSCALGDIGVFDWFSHLRGSVFYDENSNGFPDANEPGIPNQAINIRWRDGTVYANNATDSAGEYAFEEVFPFFNWLVAEVDFANYKATGMTTVVDAGGAVLPDNGWDYPSDNAMTPQAQLATNPNTGNNLSRTETGPVLTQAFQGFLSGMNYIHWGKQPYGPGTDNQYGTADDENGGISGIVFYDTTRAEDDPRYNAGELWQPGIPNVTVNLYRIDGRDTSGKPNAMTLINSTQTDSWDASLPTDCPGDPADPYTDMGGSRPNACYDGLRNFNQVRPGVFDGGYAFTSYYPSGYGNGSEVDGLPTGNYVVEVVPAAPYKVVSSLDKNVDFGETYIPSTLALPPVCVGDTTTLAANATLNLFPGVDAPLAGQSFEECNRKEVVVQSAKNAAADFFLFTEVPPAAHVKGMILNDFANEFDPNNPNFGEKFALPYVPISFKDFNGREIVRIYSDQYGQYNAAVPSTFTTNIGSPSGMSPNMLIACMNDPGPIEDPDNPGSFITDPQFKTQYTQFCYTFQYMPGTITYLDTPLQPIAAFAGQNQDTLDCELPDGTPIVKTAYGPSYNGPIVATGQTITISAMGDTRVPNPGGSPAEVIRDYGFGAVEGSVIIGGRALTNVVWTNETITGTIPEHAYTGELVIGRGDNGVASGGLIVHVNPTGTIRTVSPAGGWPDTPIQDAIDASSPGDIVLVQAGSYDELVIMDKEIVLQGAGAPVTVINVAKAPGEKLQAWRDYIEAAVANGDIDLLPGQTLNFDPQNNEPGLFNTTEAPGIMVLGQSDGGDPAQSTWGYLGGGPALIDGFSIMGGDTAGAIAVNGYTKYLGIGHNRLISNGGQYGGGITVGLPAAGGDVVDGQNDGIAVIRNHITQNGAMSGGSGGVSIYTGADGYNVSENYICGNFTSGSGGGIGHHGRNNGRIYRNKILFNQTFNQAPASNSAGGGIAVEGEVSAGLTTAGTGDVEIYGNVIQGNLAGSGDGGGIWLAYVDGLYVSELGPNTVYITTNFIVNNVSGLAGAGIALQDALDVTIAYNTIARNDSTATAAEAFVGNPDVSTQQPAGVVSRAHSAGLAGIVGEGFSNPKLVNNIIAHNRSFYWDVNAQLGPINNLPIGGLLPDPSTPDFRDLGVLGTAGSLSPLNSVLTDTTGTDASNTNGDPVFALPYFNGNSLLTTIPENTTPLNTAAAVDEAGNFIDVRFGPLQPVGDYHILAASSANNLGQAVSKLGFLGELGFDIDGDTRPVAGTPDSGADEQTDTVTVVSVVYNAAADTLTVSATSDDQPNVTLDLVAYFNDSYLSLGTLDYKASNTPPLYRSTFSNIVDRPIGIRITSSGGGVTRYYLAPADTVTIQTVAYSTDNGGTLTVIATSDAQPNVALTAEGYGVLGWKAASGFYRSTFTGIGARPASVTVNSTGGGTATDVLPAADTVTVVDVIYSAASGGTLTVIATSDDQPNVGLTANGYGLLKWKAASGFYRTTFMGIGSQPASVTVDSTGGGSATWTAPAADTVTVVDVIYSAASGGTLTVIATSDAQPNVGLTAAGYGALGWKSWLNLYRSTFTGIGSQPASVTVTSSGGGTSTWTAP